MSEKLLLDEHYSPKIAEILRNRGFDVSAVTAETALIGRTDAELMELAAAQGRRIVTENVKDFLALANAAYADGNKPTRLLLVSPKRFPRGRSRIGTLATALASWLESQTPRADQEWLV
jgi:predicted nuclease of predicted toxin-antitoxin system